MPARNTRSKIKQNKTVRLFGIGFFMGTADLVPGVSGGTVAFLMGIYEELVETIRRVTGITLRLVGQGKFTEAFKTIPFSFLIPLGMGLLLAVFSLATGLTYLLEEYPIYLYSIFFGLIAASVLIVARRIDDWKQKEIAALIIGAIGIFFIVGLSPNELASTPLVFFLTGIIAFCAMILPGISGSLIMLILGSYAAVLAAVSDRDFGLLFFLVLGGAIGLGLFSRLLHIALESFHNVTVAVLIGMMIGSLRKVWPWKEEASLDELGAEYLQSNALPSLEAGTAIAVMLLLTSFVVVFYLGKKGIIHDHKTEDLPKLPRKNT